MADWPYNTTTWQKVRRMVLVRDRYQCQLRLPGCKGQAGTVDHIIEWRKDRNRVYDPKNLQAACNSCNSAKAGYGRGGTTVGLKPSRDW